MFDQKRQSANNPMAILMRFLLLLLLATPLANAQEESASAEGAKERKEMNALGKVVFAQALAAMSKTGGIYPFAYIMKKDGAVELLGFQGDAEQRPAPEKMAAMLYQKLRNMTIDQSIIAAAVVRPHAFNDDEGVTHQGIWALVDHRNHRSWIMLLPYEIENQTLIKGKLIYQAAEERIFE